MFYNFNNLSTLRCWSSEVQVGPKGPRFTDAYAGTRFTDAYAGSRFTDAYAGSRFTADHPGVGPLGPVGPFLFGAHLGPIWGPFYLGPIGPI